MLLPKEDAIQFVSECEKRNIRILGVDSFRVFGDKIQPSLEDSIDFSMTNETTEYRKAQSFIRSRSDGFLFEITHTD